MHESVDAVRAEHRLNESPPKRKGKCGQASKLKSFPRCLNESPSPKRKGNVGGVGGEHGGLPQPQ